MLNSMEISFSCQQDSEDESEIYYINGRYTTQRPVQTKKQVGRTDQCLINKKKSFRELVQVAKTFGTAKEKPQEENRELKKIILRRNERSRYGKSEQPQVVKLSMDNIDIRMWRPTPSMLQCQQNIEDNVEDYPAFKIIDNNISYWKMHKELEKENEIGVNLEGHNLQSHLGLICLIQISTSSTNFVVDPFKIPHECEDNLKKIFENGRILKIVCDISNDVRALLRDFGMTIWPVADVQYANFLLEKQNGIVNAQVKMGFRNLVKMYLKKEIEKGPQMADWRLRPITEMKKDMINYAVRDSSLLIPLWNSLKRKIANSQTGQTSPIWSHFFDKMKDDVSSICYKPLCYESYEEEMPHGLKQNEKEYFEYLHRKRFIVSRKLDEHPKSVVSTQVLINSAKTLRPVPELQGCEPKVNAAITCFRCPEKGHTANNCPNKGKYSKSAMSRIYYQANPGKLDIEKARIEKKRIAQAEVRGIRYISHGSGTKKNN